MWSSSNHLQVLYQAQWGRGCVGAPQSALKVTKVEILFQIHLTGLKKKRLRINEMKHSEIANTTISMCIIRKHSENANTFTLMKRCIQRSWPPGSIQRSQTPPHYITVKKPSKIANTSISICSIRKHLENANTLTLMKRCIQTTWPQETIERLQTPPHYFTLKKHS